MAGRTILRLYTETAYQIYPSCVFPRVAREAFTERKFLVQNSALKASKILALRRDFKMVCLNNRGNGCVSIIQFRMEPFLPQSCRDGAGVRRALCAPIGSGFFSSLKSRALPGEERGHSFVARNHGEARAIHAQFRWNCCHQTSGVLVLFRSIWEKDVGTLGTRRLWEAPTLQTAKVGRGESHPLGLNLVSSPQECRGSIEGLVVSRLPNRRLAAQIQSAQLVLSAPRVPLRERAKVLHRPSRSSAPATSNTETPSKTSAHPERST